MKWKLSLVLAALVVGLGVWWVVSSNSPNTSSIKVENLPWQVQTLPDGGTQVFGVTVGKITFRQLAEYLRSIPELAVFETPTGQRTLEGYYGKKRLGVFEAKIVGELHADKATIERFVEAHTERKPQPTGTWRYELAEKNVLESNDFLIKYLIYIPVVDYSSEQIQTHFGTPMNTLKVDERLTWWLYPAKGLIIMQDNDGAEVFYYSAAPDYPALEQRLTTTKMTPLNHE
ncbi:MAG: hypothetical protein WAQ53_07620 [Thiofilum sp.]|uniref:hypothetical protein n=1 Tax=Thiofilum sp. TaxID=2212733 RepID=UPI0025F058A9|nr:hypothetical protein [Thiofilum sp.]MBK8453405.1 hypothetical protein [Thiofilum sp.]